MVILLSGQRWLIAALLVGALATPLYAADKKADPKKSAQQVEEEAIQQGSRLVQQKQYDQAIKQYEAALKMNPKSAKAHLLMGLTYANMGQLDKAVKFSQYALTLEPSYAAYNNLGLIYANKGELDKSAEMYEKALKLNPDSFRGWYQLGLVNAGAAKFKEAIAAYEKAIEKNPRFTDAYLGLGAAEYWAGNKAKALEQAGKLDAMNRKDLSQQLTRWIEEKEAKKASPSPEQPSGKTSPVKPS